MVKETKGGIFYTGIGMLHEAHVKTYQIRQAFPKVAKMVDEVRCMGVEKPIYAEENGKTIGKEIKPVYKWT